MRSTDELDRLGIPYEVLHHNMKSASAAQAADALNVPLSSIIKTLILIGRTIGPIVILVPGDRRLDLPSLRQELGDPTLHLASPEQTLDISGYPVGLVTPFGLKQRLPIYSYEPSGDNQAICLSSGELSAELSMRPAILVRALEPTILPANCFN